LKSVCVGVLSIIEKTDVFLTVICKFTAIVTPLDLVAP